METSMLFDIARVVIRGSLDLLLRDNAGIIEVLEKANRSDLVATINVLESSFIWLQKELEKTAIKEKA